MSDFGLDWQPPADERAEVAVLGALLVDPEGIGLVAPLLKPSDFTSTKNARIYETIVALHEQAIPGDFVTISGRLERDNLLEVVGGTGYLITLTSTAPTSTHLEAYARTVADLAHRRRLMAAGNAIRELAGGTGAADATAVLAQAEAILQQAAAGRAVGGPVSIRDVLNALFDSIGGRTEQGNHDAPGAEGAVPTGFLDVDRITGGLQPADLIILAARPSVGKSALACNFVRNAAAAGHGALLFSLEMSTQALGERLITAEASVDAHRLRQGYIDEYEWRRVSDAFGVLSELPIWFDDTAAVTLADVRSRARRARTEHGIGLVVVDYLQLMRSADRTENRTQAVGEISRGLKALARELSVPVLALSQLSRAVEARQDRRPILSDLRESGAIEQDADLVMMLYREELYHPNTERRNIADLIIAKHRSGPTASIPLRWAPTFVKFTDLELYRQAEAAL